MAGVHYSNRLEDQAAAAALYSNQEQPKASVLDDDGKLSSASAAQSLKYAQAHDLPSFPSAGLKLSSAGAAASLADSNKKSFEHWKPSPIPAANRAANLAKDYEMDPLWQPQLSAAGSKAALLAHRDGATVNIWKSSGTEAGHSAAGQALKSKPPNAITERNVGAEDRRKALLAATGAMSGNRRRSDSLPVGKDEGASWALKAATSSHKGVPNSGPFTSGDPGFEAARIQNLAKNNVNRQLYGSAPPVAIEVEEKNRQDTLKASAIAMAKKMYAIQQSHIDEASGARRSDSRAAATSSQQRKTLSDASGDVTPAAVGNRYENLEEAARRLAQERLAKLHDEHAEYRSYYGASTTPQRSRLSMRLHRRASTGGKEEDSDDEEQSRRIRKQMSLFQSKLAEVDGKKRQADRDALLEAAQRNVEARMAKMDEKVFQDTGKASPAQKELWEKQARERAQLVSDERMQNFGKVHIGGGQYMDQADIDAIAKARLQPTLDEISDTAERQRARDEEIRLEHARKQDQLAKERAREAEVKAEMKAAQEQEKLEARTKKEYEKQVEKDRFRKEKEQRQVAAAEERETAKAKAQQRQAEDDAERERIRVEKAEQRKSAEVKPGRFNSILRRKGKETGAVADTAPTTSADEAVITTTTTAHTTTALEPVSSEPTTTSVEGATVHDSVTLPVTEEHEATKVTSVPNDEAAIAVPASTTALPASTEAAPSSGRRESKMKSWFKSALKGSGKTSKEEVGTETKPPASEALDKTRDESIHDVAMAGRETEDLYGSENKDRPVSPVHEPAETKASKASSISSTSHDAVVAEARPLSGTEHTAQVGRTGLKAKLLRKVKSPKEDHGEINRDSTATATTDDEDFQEAKDKMDDDTLQPPAVSTTKPASPRASHDQSRFKEEL